MKLTKKIIILVSNITGMAFNLSLYDSGKLNFVEFNTTGDNETHIRCDVGSRFLDTTVFNLFLHCFEKSDKLYEYFGPTKYNARKIIPLRNEMIANLDKLKSINDVEQFIDFIQQAFLGIDFLRSLEEADKNWQINWNKHVSLLITLNQDLISLIDNCIENERILWVIGY